MFNIQPPKFECGSSSFGRAIAFQAIGGEFEPRLPLHQSAVLQSAVNILTVADWRLLNCRLPTELRRCSSVVEHFLGKEEVKGSIPFNGS
jgi:hypothetical protein